MDILPWKADLVNASAVDRVVRSGQRPGDDLSALPHDVVCRYLHADEAFGVGDSGLMHLQAKSLQQGPPRPLLQAYCKVNASRRGVR